VMAPEAVAAAAGGSSTDVAAGPSHSTSSSIGMISGLGCLTPECADPAAAVEEQGEPPVSTNANTAAGRSSIYSNGSSEGGVSSPETLVPGEGSDAAPGSSSQPGGRRRGHRGRKAGSKRGVSSGSNNASNSNAGCASPS
jgi:hypothetical protein